MQIRCASCLAAVWFQVDLTTKDRKIVRCPTCSQEYDLAPTLKRIDVADLHQDALVLAKGSEIDVPSAYSVLLGVLSLDAAKDGCEPSLRPSDHTVDTDPDLEFDEDFAEAVKAGHLTAQDARQRGSRQAFAEKIMARHRLPLKLALAVADSRISLLQAKRSIKPKVRIHVGRERSRRSTVPFVIAGAAAILAIGVFFALTRGRDGTETMVRPASARSDLSAVEVKVNPNGEPIEVIGRDPESVLAGYCESASSGGRVAVGVEAADDEWTASYREDGTLYAVSIRRDGPRNLWVAGDAVDPIEAERRGEHEGPADLNSNVAGERLVVVRDEKGDILRVSAADPARVLIAYCHFEAMASGCEPLELRAGIPADAGLRLGVYRDFSEQLLRITIRRQQQDGRWIAGDGSRLIEVGLAGEATPGSFVIPVS